ncbi:hypothetical protein D3C86_2130060 [compost metagenome]
MNETEREWLEALDESEYRLFIIPCNEHIALLILEYGVLKYFEKRILKSTYHFRFRQ